MVLLRATRYYFLLTNHSIHTIKGNEQNLINGLFESLKTLDIIGASDFFDLLPLAPFKLNLNIFVYEIYQRVFILFELSVKHTLSDFLLPFCCQKFRNGN